MNKETLELTKALGDFFTIYLPKQKCYSENTITSYRYAFNLFFDFLRSKKDISISKASIKCLSNEYVSEYIDWLSAERNNSASTCNQRLMALRSFAQYIGTNDYSKYMYYTEMTSVPMKKGSAKTVDFLSESALEALLNQPNTDKSSEMRNQFIMILMYDTAARCQEILDIRIKDICFNEKAPYIYLTGKGNKIRSVPIMDKTYKHLMNYLKKFHNNYKLTPDEYLFYITTYGKRHQISKDTVESFMKRYGKLAKRTCSDIPDNVHPHQLRHTRAIHLYRSGMPLSVLSEFLGHSSEETTRVYAYADTEMKRKAIEKATADIGIPEETPVWDENDEEMIRKLAGLI